MIMNKKLSVSLVAVLALSAQGALAADLGPELIEAQYHTGYTPDGFDTNDSAQVVAEGLFPNTCFRPATPLVRVDHEKKTVTVDSKAYYYEGFCLQMLVPYDQTLDLGLLKAGKYDVIQKVRQGELAPSLGELNVRVATNSSADDFLYAPISQAFFESKDGKKSVRVTGEFTNSCLELVDVMINVQTKVVVLQPISELKTENCRTGKFPFERTVELPADMKAGRYLIHVRSLNGKAVNTLVDVGT
jgi:hypothetical protein